MPWPALGRFLILAACVLRCLVVVAGGESEGGQCEQSSDPCMNSKKGLLDMAIEPLDMEAFVFGSTSDPAVFENEVYEVIPRDAEFFASLNFTSHIMFRLMENVVSIEKEKLGQPAVHGEDYYLVKRVKGKDGEWWSGRVPDAYNNASAVYRWFRKGFTLVLNNADSRHAQLAAWANGLEDELGYMVQLNAYLTPPTSQGFEVHWDPMETLIVQLEGQKTWSVYDPIIELPRPEQRFKPTTKQVNYSSHFNVHMVGGGALYLPRGWLHENSHPSHPLCNIAAWKCRRRRTVLRSMDSTLCTSRLGSRLSTQRGSRSAAMSPLSTASPSTSAALDCDMATLHRGLMDAARGGGGQAMQSILLILAQEKPSPLATVHTVPGSTSGTTYSISAQSLLHWAIRGAALQSPLLRRAVSPQKRGEEERAAQIREEEATCKKCIRELQGRLGVASVQLAVDTLEGRTDRDLQLKSQVGEVDEAALVDENGRQRLLRGGEVEKILGAAAALMEQSAPEHCAAGVAAVRHSARTALVRRQLLRRERLVRHGVPCAGAAAAGA